VTLLPLPIHKSHTLQPLDRSMYEPYKKNVKIKCNSLIINNFGKITSYDTPFKKSVLFQMKLE
jgi:hypothetical protein